MDGSLSRIAAARVLDAVLHHGRSLRAELAATLPGIEDVRDRALVEAICHAALRNHPRYHAALAAWMPKALPRGDHPLRALLYAGFAQIDPLGLPAHAAVSATVGAARAMGRAHQAGLVNALLRRALRDGLPPPDPAAAWPDWLLRRLDADWPGERDAIVAASAQAAPMWLRVNARATTRAAYLHRLRGDGIAAEADPHLADALRLDTPLPVAALPGFAEGQVSVQDGAAQSVADAMAPPEVTPARPRRVLDACAAPGGKAAHLLEREPSIHLTALDLDEARLRRVRETFGRLRIGQDARLVAADAADPAAWRDGVGFDAILLDAPCSATGIVRRQPDVLLHRRESDLSALVALQARLLDALWTTLAPGGVLLYATCSILHEENARQVETFLARTADARAEPLPGHLGRVAGPGRQRLPGEGGMDGFFQARLRKAGP